jgi:hypothetical protein
MPNLVIAGILWLVLDVALLALWAALTNGRDRWQVRAMVRAAERHANSTRPVPAALNSGHAEDPEIRDARRRAQAVQAELNPH